MAVLRSGKVTSGGVSAGSFCRNSVSTPLRRGRDPLTNRLRRRAVIKKPAKKAAKPANGAAGKVASGNKKAAALVMPPARRVNTEAVRTKLMNKFHMEQPVSFSCDDSPRSSNWFQLLNSPYLSTVLSRGVRSLFGPTRKSSPWGNFSDGGLNQSSLDFYCKLFGWLIDWR